MLVFKLIQQFLLPSTIFLMIGLVGFILLQRSEKKRIGKNLLLATMLLYFLFSITPVADLLLRPLEKGQQAVTKNQLKQAVYLVMLRGGGQTDVLRASEILRLFHINPELKVIISGTQAINPEDRRQIMATRQFLINRGIPEQNIMLEDLSRNTFENAAKVKNLIDKQQFILVTSAYHMPRAKLAFLDFNQQANLIPAPTDFLITPKYDLFDFFPNPDNLKKINLATHEYLGILFYKLFK